MSGSAWPQDQSSETSYESVPEPLSDWAIDEDWESEWEQAWGKITMPELPMSERRITKDDPREPDLSTEARLEFKRLYETIAATVKEHRRQVLVFSSVNSGDGASFVFKQMSRRFAESSQQRIALVIIDDNQNALPEQELFALRLTEFQNLYETSFAFTEGTSLKSCLTLFNSFLDRLRRNFDLILIDAPAATKCPATARISVQCDGTILVAREGATSEQSIEEVYELFESSLAEVIGVVMNHCRANEDGVQGVSLLQEAA